MTWSESIDRTLKNDGPSLKAAVNFLGEEGPSTQAEILGHFRKVGTPIQAPTGVGRVCQALEKSQKVHVGTRGREKVYTLCSQPLGPQAPREVQELRIKLELVLSV